jgi:predicted O-methyltransferase YrrM
MLVKLTDAHRILEVGLYTGYSALTMAEAMARDGTIISCEIEREMAALAQSFFDRSPHGRKIEVRIGPALATLQALPAGALFDLVFLDADKENYCAYYKELLPRLRAGGLLIADNTLWSGNVLKPEQETDRAIVGFNDLVQRDPQVENVLLTVRDGMTLIRKL